MENPLEEGGGLVILTQNMQNSYKSPCKKMYRGYLKLMRNILYIPSIPRLQKNIKVFAKKIIFFLFFCVFRQSPKISNGNYIKSYAF
jgi:hypothetical protein